METLYDLVFKIIQDRSINFNKFYSDTGVSPSTIRKWKYNPEIIPYRPTLEKIIKTYKLPDSYFDGIELRNIESKPSRRATKQQVFELFEQYEATKSRNWLSEQTMWTRDELDKAYTEYLREKKNRRTENG